MTAPHSMTFASASSPGSPVRLTQPSSALRQPDARFDAFVDQWIDAMVQEL
ncbi:MAG: hypothetical protein AAFU41_15465 [Pseudomonadota bacterium]